MLYNIIKNYTEKITKNDIINFSHKYNHELKEYEVNLIYNEIKNNLDNILLNSDLELHKIKDKLEYTTYLKILELKEKYINYL